MKTRTLLAVVSTTLFVAGHLSAQTVLFQDQMTSSSGWGVNAVTADYLATFNYDYSANGIPEAPNSQLGDTATRGLKLEANLFDEAVSYFTAYPTGQSFTGIYTLRFDAWMNYGTGGTTEFLGGGVAYNDTDADLTSGFQAIATGDGGSSQDWRAFDNGTYFPLGNGNTEPYVSFLPSVNGSVAGSPGFQWITWEFNVLEDHVSIVVEKPDMSRLLLTTLSSTNTTDGNISLFYADFFTSLGDPASDTFGLIDNVLVVTPEPTTAALALLGAAGLLVSRRRK